MKALFLSQLKITNYYISLLFANLLGLASCDEIIEPSISKKTVVAEAPADNYQSASYTVGFWWDQVDHALTYHLQVVSGTFDSPGSLALDTVVAANKFSFNFNPGKYQWRVQAENGSTQTAFTAPRSFVVLQSSIKQQSVQLQSPANGYLINQSAPTLQWASLYGATRYQLEVDTNNFADENTLVVSQSLTGQQYSLKLLKDNVYQWRVKAVNDTAQSQWSATYAFTYDHTPPGVVSLSSPADSTTQAKPVSLQWGAVATASKYKLYVYKADGVTAYSTSFPAVVTGTSYSFNSGNSGDRILWKVSAIDAAGNEGAASSVRSFTIQ